MLGNLFRPRLTEFDFEVFAEFVPADHFLRKAYRDGGPWPVSIEVSAELLALGKIFCRSGGTSPTAPADGKLAPGPLAA